MRVANPVLVAASSVNPTPRVTGSPKIVGSMGSSPSAVESIAESHQPTGSTMTLSEANLKDHQSCWKKPPGGGDVDSERLDTTKHPSPSFLKQVLVPLRDDRRQQHNGISNAEPQTCLGSCWSDLIRRTGGGRQKSRVLA